MSTKTFNVAFPVQLLSQVDEFADSEFGSRSDLLRQATMEYMERRNRFKELLSEGKKLQKTAQLKSDKEVAEYITKLRRSKALASKQA